MRRVPRRATACGSRRRSRAARRPRSPARDGAPTAPLRGQQLRPDADLAEPVAVADRAAPARVVADDLRPARNLGGLEPQTVEHVDAEHPPGALERKDRKWLLVREEPRVRAPPLAVQPRARRIGSSVASASSSARYRTWALTGGVIRTRTCSNPHRNSGVSPAVAAQPRNVDSRPCSPPPPSAPSSVLRLPFSPRARTQIGLFLLAYLVYSAARFVTIGDLASAKDNAHWIVNLQNSLDIGVEASVQGALDGTWLAVGAQPPVPDRPARRDPGGADLPVSPLPRRSTRTLRNTILATWLISVPVYGLFPVAPPRLADIGIADTISTQTACDMNSSLTTSFYNELAAVPSLHVGFAMAVGFALFAAVRNPVAALRRAAVGPDHRPRRGRHRQPLRLRHDRRHRRQRAGLRPRHHGRADPHQAADRAPTLGPAFAEA